MKLHKLTAALTFGLRILSAVGWTRRRHRLAQLHEVARAGRVKTQMLLSGVLPLLLGLAAVMPAQAQTAKARSTFAGGCFWCVEEAFEKVDGVLTATSGYTGGQTPNPTYEQVSDGATGHAESVEVMFDPAKVTYEQLVLVFWHSIDPLAIDAQFCDHGRQYRSAIFYHNEEQRLAAEASKAALEQSKRFDQPIVTEFLSRRRVLPGGRLSSRLLLQESGPLQVLQMELWPGATAGEALGPAPARIDSLTRRGVYQQQQAETEGGEQA